MRTGATRVCVTRIGCWASLALIGIACTNNDKTRASTEHVQPSVVTARTEGGRTALTVQSAGSSHTVTVDRDATVASSAAPTAATVAGEIAGQVIVIVDNYPSIAGGMSYCGAGVERFLRVLSIAATPPVETYRLKLASCRENVELASDSIVWQPESAALRVHWLNGPNGKHKSQVMTLRIARDGKTRAIVE